MTSPPVRLGASELLATVLDGGTWVGWDEPPSQPTPPDSPYAAELTAAAKRAGTNEAIIADEGGIHLQTSPPALGRR